MQSKINEGTITKAPVVLWIVSWYPSTLDPFPGDFIQRSAKAFSLYYPLHIFYIAKDEDARLTPKHREETTQNGNLTETILYYHPHKIGLALPDKIISTFQYTWLGRQWLKKFRELHKGKNILVEVGVAMRAGTLALWMYRKWGTPYVVQEHWTGYYRDLMPASLQKPKWFWKLTKQILDNANAIFPDSRHLGETISKYISKVPFQEIPNTVNTDLFYYTENVKTTSAFRFIHVSTLGYQKNTEAILRVIIRLKEKNPEQPIELLVVGPDPEQLQQTFGKGKLERFGIRFTGAKTYAEVADIMQQSDVLVLFSRFENLPCVMLEAMCCGLPVIATRVGGIAYHLDEHGGLLIDSENEEQLLAAMENMIDNYAIYNKKSIAQKATALYAMPVIGKRYMQAYQTYFIGFEAPVNP